MKKVRVDRNIETLYLLNTAPQIYPNVCTPLPEHADSNSTKPLCSKISKTEAQLTALKSYVSCKISSFHSKTEYILQRLQVTLKEFQEKETKTNKNFHQNTTFLQKELLTKN